MQNSSSDLWLARAMHLHRQGNTAEAIKLYKKVVQKLPCHAPALNLLGLAYFQSGKPALAVQPLQRALALAPDLPAGHYNLGRILHELKRYKEARQQYEVALARSPDDAEIHSNLGVLLRDLDQHEEAVARFRRALELKPEYGEAWVNLGNALHALARHEEACAAFARGAALKPTLPEVHMNWGQSLIALERHQEALARFDAAVALRRNDPVDHLNRGRALHKLERFAEALTCYERVLELDGSDQDAWRNMGAALFEQGRYQEAVNHYRRALAIQPDDAGTSLNLADALSKLDQFDEAIGTCRFVISRRPADGRAHLSLASALESAEQDEAALEHYSKAAELLPDDPRPKWFKAYLDLALGRLAEGWASFEARWPARQVAPRAYPQPRWDGRVVDGRLLVWGEQGLGDQILYASLIEELQGYARSICLEVEPRLVALFARSFPAVKVVPLGSELYSGAIEAHVPVASLAPYLRPDWQSFRPITRGFLKADRGRVAELRSHLAGDGRRVIGLSWQSVSRVIGAAKSAELRDFAAILRMPGCRFVDLQYSDTTPERMAISSELGLEIVRLESIDNRDDIDALAALMSACDVVVSVSNTNAHLAAALGRPTWILLPVGGARLWYWFRDRGASPWYPRARLVRRVQGQAWADLIASAVPEIEMALERNAAPTSWPTSEPAVAE
jgi:tetratricopeptide (TPR) repeat protein